MDPDLSSNSTIERYRIAISFIAYTRQARIHKGTSNYLKKDTIRKIVEDVGETMELRGIGSAVNFFLDEKGKLRNIILRILKSYQVWDPPVKRESPITPAMLRHIKKKAASPRARFLANLVIRAYFFAIRSCEYSKTPGFHQTEVLTMNRISFIRNDHRYLRTVDTFDPNAGSVQITFGIQKNLEMDEPVSNYQTSKDLYPIRA